MALGLMDMLLPWRRDRWSSFTSGPARHHEYMMYVGLGWAMARMRRRVDGIWPVSILCWDRSHWTATGSTTAISTGAGDA